MPNRYCQACKKTVETKKAVHEGPLFDIYKVVCIECEEVIEDGVHEDRSDFEHLNESNLPPINRV